jgi:hypothetical protein
MARYDRKCPSCGETVSKSQTPTWEGKSHSPLRGPEKPTQIESLFMLSRYDLFELTDGSSIWVGSANTIEEVKAQVRRRIAGAPQEWVILDQVTGHKSVLTPKQIE